MAAKNNKKSEKGSGDKQQVSQQQPAGKAQKKVTLIDILDFIEFRRICLLCLL